MEQAITVDWIDRHREPKCAPNPSYPLGRDIDVSDGSDASCKTVVPYPANRCGVYVLRCSKCGMSAVVTTAGRVDDPRSVTLPCRLTKG